MQEAGVDGYESTVWFGLVVAAGTPKAMVDRLNAAGREAAKAPAFTSRLGDLGYGIVGNTSPEQMASMIADEVKRWEPIVKASGAKID
jgi:tripartite-type tricarboxylate transporter receptor subunit TctC